METVLNAHGGPAWALWQPGNEFVKLPRRAVEDTKRVINLHLERAVISTIDFALAAEDRSFTSSELRAIARISLAELETKLAAARNKATDVATRAHIDDLRSEIGTILAADKKK